MLTNEIFKDVLVLVLESRRTVRGSLQKGGSALLELLQDRVLIQEVDGQSLVLEEPQLAVLATLLSVLLLTRVIHFLLLFLDLRL